MNLNNKVAYFILKILILSLFSITIVATSYKRADDSLFISKSYSATSNCANASFTSGIVSVRAGQVETPAGTTFLNLGFPSVTVSIGSDVSAEIAIALVRTCRYSQSVISNTTTSIYDCDDNGIPSCTINLIHLD